jgi:hypothetical protein
MFHACVQRFDVTENLKILQNILETKHGLSSRNKVTEHGLPLPPKPPRLKIEIAGRSRILVGQKNQVPCSKQKTTPTSALGDNRRTEAMVPYGHGTGSRRLLVLGRTRGPRALADLTSPLPQPSPRYKIRYPSSPSRTCALRLCAPVRLQAYHWSERDCQRPPVQS